MALQTGWRFPTVVAQKSPEEHLKKGRAQVTSWTSYVSLSLCSEARQQYLKIFVIPVFLRIEDPFQDVYAGPRDHLRYSASSNPCPAEGAILPHLSSFSQNLCRLRSLRFMTLFHWGNQTLYVPSSIYLE